MGSGFKLVPLLKIVAKQGIITGSQNYKVLIELDRKGKYERLFYIRVKMITG
jgi:hypothetical protein